ncbi:MAG: conserved hypothetical protein [Marine Group I thaumarchaeote]|nr:MAG: conserved hypothetical protein [Marine Group I thaumarchaeote]
MITQDDFYCTYCGKNFRNEPIKLAVHIRDYHEAGRGKNKLKL